MLVKGDDYFVCCACKENFNEGRQPPLVTGCADHVVRDKAVFSNSESCTKMTTMENPNATRSIIEEEDMGKKVSMTDKML